MIWPGVSGRFARDFLIDIALWSAAVIAAGFIVATAIWWGPEMLLWTVEYFGGAQ